MTPTLVIDHLPDPWVELPLIDDGTGPPDHAVWARSTAEAITAGDAPSTRAVEAVLVDLARRIAARGEDPETDRVVLLHLPDPSVPPLAVYITVWGDLGGDRDEVLRELARAADPEAVEAPIVDPFPSAHLGAGLRSLAHFVDGEVGDDGVQGLYAVLSYAWRVDRLAVDVRVSSSSTDIGRLVTSIEDIDELVGGLRVEDVGGPRADAMTAGT